MDGMKIVCWPISFGRWKAEFWVDGVLYASAIGQRPGCVVRDVMNSFCLKMDSMPTTRVEIEFKEWE